MNDATIILCPHQSTPFLLFGWNNKLCCLGARHWSTYQSKFVSLFFGAELSFSLVAHLLADHLFATHSGQHFPGYYLVHS
jgi:hypothetical protein